MLEGELTDEKFSALLVTADLKDSDCPWPVPVRCLNTSAFWGILPIGLGDQLLLFRCGCRSPLTRVSIMTNCVCFVGSLPLWPTDPLAFS